MISLAQPAFISRFGTAWEPANHHFTGPSIAQQTEGNGSVFHEEGCILATYAAEHGGPVLEIGSDLGISSRYIREGLDYGDKAGFPIKNSRLFCVDIYHKWDSRCYDDRIEQFHTTADKFTPPEPCIWAFIDGDHQYAAVQADIRRCLELGINDLFFHDTAPDMPAAKSASEGSDARRAVLDFFALRPDWTLEDIATHCGMIHAYRNQE